MDRELIHMPAFKVRFIHLVSSNPIGQFVTTTLTPHDLRLPVTASMQSLTLLCMGTPAEVCACAYEMPFR